MGNENEHLLCEVYSNFGHTHTIHDPGSRIQDSSSRLQVLAKVIVAGNPKIEMSARGSSGQCGRGAPSMCDPGVYLWWASDPGVRKKCEI